MAPDPDLEPAFWFTDPKPDERHGLEQFLDYQRNVMLRKTHGLNADQLAHTIHPSSISLGWLLAHLALVEDTWMQERLHDRPLPEPWLAIEAAMAEGDPPADETFVATASPADLRDVYVAAIDRSREAMGGLDLDHETHQPNWDGRTKNVRWLYLHMIEEYARHLGHADFLRESIDGRYGD